MHVRLHVPAAFTALAAVLLAACPAFAGWQSSGVPTCTSCGMGIFRDGSAAADGAGGVYVASWNGSRMNFVRRLSITGDDAAGWTSAGAQVTTITSVTRTPRLAIDGAGGVYVTFLSTGCVAHCQQWETGDVMLQRLTPTGRAAGWPAAGVSLGVSAGDPALPIPDGQGGVIVASTWPDVTQWASTGYPPYRIYLQRVDPTGQVLWTQAAGGVQVAPLSDGHQATPTLVPDGSGGAFVAWTDRRSTSRFSKIYVQHVGASGALADSAGRPLAAEPCAQAVPQLLADGAGGAFVAWLDSTTSTTVELHAQHLAADGTATWGGGVTVATGAAGSNWPYQPPSPPALEHDGAGGVFVAWADSRSGTLRTWVARLDGAGHVVAPWPAGGLPANADAEGQGSPQLATDGAGGVFVSWIGATMNATHLRADGSRAGGWPAAGLALCTYGPEHCESAEGWPVSLVADGFGGAVAVWQEWRSYPYPNGYDAEHSYVQRIADDGPVSALAALVSADATGERVRIEWWTAASGALRVLRAAGAAGAGWAPLAYVTPDGESHVAVEDANVQPGERYGYRLVRATSGAEEVLDEAWITVPVPGKLRIDGARPNPARGELRLAFELPVGAPATIEVLDVAGRWVAGQRELALGAGAHEVALRGSAALPSGVYLVRLAQAGSVAGTRICVVR